MRDRQETASGRVKRVVIVGGGTSGWMCAAALSRLVAHAGVEITLVESDEIGTIGVGEATIPSILDFNAALGLDEDEFLRETQGTFKLGIEFVGWNRPDERYIHPFGMFGRDTQAIKFHQLWLKFAQRGDVELGPIEDYNLCAMAARLGRFARPAGRGDSVLSSLRYAFHFDAGLYARYLRGYSERRGVVRREGKITEVLQHADNGFIRAVKLANGEQIEGDLFVDCSGFRGLLIEETLHAGYETWNQWLPCDRAVAAPSSNVGPPPPYTRATADEAGWRWRIPLQHRTGNGYVYCSSFISDDDAEQRLLSTLEGAPLADPRRLKFVAGRRKAFWIKNCVAVGLAGGFIEPLESTSIHLAQNAIARLLALFPDKDFSQPEIDEFNRLNQVEYEQTRDFIILHYKANNRSEPFWRRLAQMPIPDSLQSKIDLFKSRGRALRGVQTLFTEDSWIAVMLGQGIHPDGYDPLVDSLPEDEARRFVRHVREMVGKTAQAMPLHAKFLEGLVVAPAPAGGVEPGSTTRAVR
ncbi:Tryptophan halogenase [Caulobacter sp. AP07]|uniref:tryptophan halogenase family protein n=1 Tax=Caulobacter sp. AP07 TaxID=1144304 RepID=UPI0002721A97|nr:tryptophan halogenase family protein [Caulobacter sp. AP07]EJL37989.1 Tryptophan halogenase [Caulobacter sp. AP07]